MAVSIKVLAMQYHPRNSMSGLGAQDPGEMQQANFILAGQLRWKHRSNLLCKIGEGPSSLVYRGAAMFSAILAASFLAVLSPAAAL